MTRVTKNKADVDMTRTTHPDQEGHPIDPNAKYLWETGLNLVEIIVVRFLPDGIVEVLPARNLFTRVSEVPSTELVRIKPLHEIEDELDWRENQ